MTKRKIIAVIAILVLAFIWIQSIVPESKSAHESLWITKTFLDPVFRHLGLPEVDKDVVRKVAHVMEFLLLSGLMTSIWDGNVIRSFYMGFTIAFIDETIQVISGRGALITDVWIDLIGVLLGTAVGRLIWRASLKHNFDENGEFQ